MINSICLIIPPSTRMMAYCQKSIKIGGDILDVTKEEIKKYLNDVKSSVNAGKYQFSPRQKNQILYIDYVFSETKAKEIILDLSVNDFSNKVQNDHPDHPEEMLYIFGKDVKLLPKYGGKEKFVSLYIKINKLRNNYVIVISLHEQEYPLTYRFK